MRTLEHIVQDEYGLHARPASQMAEICKAGKSSVSLRCGDRQADFKRLFTILGAGVQRSETIVLRIEGPDEDEVYAALEAYMKENGV